MDDLKHEVENLKKEIKSLKQNQLINNHRISQLENEKDISVFDKGKAIIDEEIDPKFLGMMQIVTTHCWYINCTILINNDFKVSSIAMIDSSVDVSCIQEGLIPL